MSEVRLTAGEKARSAALVARMCKRGVAGDQVHIADLTRRVDRIHEEAARRTEREQAAMKVELETARQAVALAKTAVRTADRTTKPAAKAALRAAEDALRRTERAARRIGL
ncbi:DUF6257 family protein [Streptomyces sp. NBC_00963]|uniref:DUF6257 family protein n=1 Tax=Streptomyces sp. NBC_00963 TaxID=2903697 RepID=UPI003867624B|nr:DUF6257 family protein [Streptomyces sp. NBC_00963]